MVRVRSFSFQLKTIARSLRKLHTVNQPDTPKTTDGRRVMVHVN